MTGRFKVDNMDLHLHMIYYQSAELKICADIIPLTDRTVTCNMTEEELALKCADADPYARKKLYEVYGGQLLAICLRYVSDRDSAQDVFHDGIIKIFHSIGQFKFLGEGSLKAWLSRVMVNEALSFLRKKNLRMQQESLVEQLPDTQTDDDDGDVNDIPEKELMRMIRELPEGYRTVFNLYVFEEKSHKEIASILGISEHSSSSQFYRAKKTLMKKINEYRKNL